MSNGIGAYYSPSTLRPVPGPTSGMGAYFTPTQVRPVGEAPSLGQFAGVVFGVALLAFIMIAASQTGKS